MEDEGDDDEHLLRALIIAPTRELALQVSLGGGLEEVRRGPRGSLEGVWRGSADYPPHA